MVNVRHLGINDLGIEQPSLPHMALVPCVGYIGRYRRHQVVRQILVPHAGMDGCVVSICVRSASGCTHLHYLPRLQPSAIHVAGGLFASFFCICLGFQLSLV